ncbi:PREDICTED: uncharacterized protein LOC108359122 [Rhagoletis zephyria]|uniref:uncharacterized protein LOC108359122 n=1 Tax=Rhagoletis zephyria TaxID=28612 RepID=UPI000811966A|nr:PREDICTED: uncharacterized protein LOC108359122 [Rhagoletis zephyria]XP_036332297.1 uncharacterized protein LOC118743639 [Rhagoletis pomonella]
MSLPDKKRNRLPNFSIAEENLLIALAEQHASVIENKKTDATSWEEKRKAWDIIDEEFEAQMGIKRGSKHLREKYDNLKRKARRDLARDGHCMDANMERLALLMGLSTNWHNRVAGDETFFEDSMYSSTTEDVADATEAVEIDMKCDPTSCDPIFLEKKSDNITHNTKYKKRRVKRDSQQIFWENEEKRAAERHTWALKKHELEIREAEVKTDLLNIELECAKQKLLSTNCTL